MKVLMKDVKIGEKRLNDLIGYERFRFNHRYNYFAIDEYNQKGKCERTYRSGLKLREVDLIYDAMYYVLT